MRFFKTRTFKTAIMAKSALENILMTNLNLNSNEAKQVVVNLKENSLYLTSRFINICLLCRKYQIEVKPLEHLPYCLKLFPYTFEHRINILKDMGVQKICVTHISKLISYLNKPVFEFKKLTNIPSNLDIRENIFCKLDEYPTDMSQLKLLDNIIKTKDYYQKCLLFCKTQIFDLPNLDDKILLETGLKFKSISMIAETLKMLRHDLNCNNEYIMKNPKIITATSDNVKSLLNNFRDTGLLGLSIEEILKQHPHLMFEDANNIKKILKSLKHYGLPDTYALKFTRIFTLDNNLFIKRMRKIIRHPDLRMWHKHPRILEIIVYEKMVMDRAKYLRYINRIKWARANTVLSHKKLMDRFLQYGPSTVLSPKSLRYMLNTKLNIQLENVDLIERLKRHPHWKMAGFDDIEKMLDYLMKNFTIDEICQNIHIILYSQSAVEEMLAKLRQKYSQSTGYSLTNSQYLALCLYMLEKDTHFTGDGIWTKGHNVKEQSLSSDRSAMNRTDSAAYIDVSSQIKASDKIDLNLCDKNVNSTTTM